MSWRFFAMVCILLTGVQCADKQGDDKKTAVGEDSQSRVSGVSGQGLSAFVDISHHDLNVDLQTAKKAGLAGFFHKATQGVHFVDNLYGERVKAGRDLGLLIGAYHFGTAEPVEAQVDSFLSVLKKYDSKGIVPVLDWEDNPVIKEGTMSKAQAQQFITLFYQKTGVYPMVYGGYWMLYQLRNEQDIATFSNAPLWQAFYSSSFGYLDGIWETWAFLQYTNGTLGPEPHAFEGIGNVDRNIFNGTLEEAVTFWQKNALK